MERYFDINRSGCSIKCKLYGESVRGLEHAVLFVHGFGGHKDNRAAARFAESLLGKMKKTAVITFDLPCHGTDVKKKLTLEDCDMYMTYVIEYIRDEMKIDDICLYATSFGAYLSLKYIHDHGNPFRKLALRSPAVNIYESLRDRVMTPENHKALEKGRDAFAGFDRKVPVSRDFLNELCDQDIRTMDFLDYADDILIIHGSKDEIIPVDEVRNFAENNVIDLEEVPNADHRFQDLNLLMFANSRIISQFI